MHFRFKAARDAIENVSADAPREKIGVVALSGKRGRLLRLSSRPNRGGDARKDRPSFSHARTNFSFPLFRRSRRQRNLIEPNVSIQVETEEIQLVGKLLNLEISFFSILETRERSFLARRVLLSSDAAI